MPTSIHRFTTRTYKVELGEDGYQLKEQLTKIWTGTQAQYDAIGTKCKYTILYHIGGSYENWHNRY